MIVSSLFVGCSFTSGKGFELEKDEPSLWVNLLHAQSPLLNKTELINHGVSGASNSDIFYNAVSSLVKHCPKYAFVQWTSSPRYKVKLGVETYPSEQYFSMDSEVQSHNLHKLNYSAEYLESVRNRFLTLHHPHGNILDIIKYVNTLINLSQLTKTTIFFINGLCPWDDQFFNKIKNGPPSNYTNYTQHILESKTRDDDEVFALYNKIHNEYTQAGSIQQSHWLNLYNSFVKNKIDTNNDQTHPGIKSNHRYFELVNQSLSHLN